jgi:hypothetical protein
MPSTQRATGPQRVTASPGPGALPHVAGCGGGGGGGGGGGAPGGAAPGGLPFEPLQFGTPPKLPSLSPPLA